MFKKAKRLLKPSKKDDYGINLIFLAVDNNSEELLIYILAINNKSLSTTVSNRETLHRRLKQVGHFLENKLVIPCLLFSVLDSDNKLANRLCPLPYRLMDTNDLENLNDLHIYELQTINDHLLRGVIFKQLEKIIKANRVPDSQEIMDYITSIGTPEFKDKIELAIHNFSNNCTNIRNKLKRTNLNIAQYLYNYDHAFFAREVQVCNHTVTGNFADNLETLCYNSGIGEVTNVDNKTYIVNIGGPDTVEKSSNSLTSPKIESPIRVSSSEEENNHTLTITEVSEEPQTSPAIEERDKNRDNQLGSNSASENSEINVNKSHNQSDDEDPVNKNLDSMNHTKNKSDSVQPQTVQPELYPLNNHDINRIPTSSEVSADIQKHLGENPFFYQNKPNPRMYSTPPKDSCPDMVETTKLLSQTQLSEDSIVRLNKAADLGNPIEQDTRQILSFELDSSTPKTNEKSRVKFDSKNEYNYISDDRSSSLKKPNTEIYKLDQTTLPIKIPQPIIKQPKINTYTYKSNKELVATPCDKFQPQGVSTPYFKSDHIPKNEPIQENIHILCNDYSENNDRTDHINPAPCTHEKSHQGDECELCVREKIEFANKHHADYVRTSKTNSPKALNQTNNKTQYSNTHNKEINCISKEKIKTKKPKKQKKNKKYDSSSSSSSSDGHKKSNKNNNDKNKNRKSRKSDPSSEDSSDATVISDFDSRRYSNLSARSNENKLYKLRSTLKYPRLSKEAGLAPQSYFDRFCTTLQINLEKGALEDVPVIIITHLLAEMMLAEFAPQREIFKNKCAKAETLDEVRNAFAKALSESHILRERRFEEISSKPKDITWKTFASNLFQVFKNAFPHERRPLHSKLLILKFKSIIPSNLRRSYELAKVNTKETYPNLFEIAETLDQISSFQMLEGEDKSVFSINRESPKNIKDELVRDQNHIKLNDNTKNNNRIDIDEKSNSILRQNSKNNNNSNMGNNSFNNFNNRVGSFQDRFRNQNRQNLGYNDNNNPHPGNSQNRMSGYENYHNPHHQGNNNFRLNHSYPYRYGSYPFGLRNQQNGSFRQRSHNFNFPNERDNNIRSYQGYSGNHGNYRGFPGNRGNYRGYSSNQGNYRGHPVNNGGYDSVERKFNTKYRY